MPPISPDLTELNERRRRAVQLRVDGHSLRQICAATGLSEPTVIRACQAFREGGWRAIAVAPRGRSLGDGRLLDGAQEAWLRHAALHRTPLQLGLPDGLWQQESLQTLTQQRWGMPLPDRSAARLLARWGLAPQSLKAASAQHPAAAGWQTSVWAPALIAARAHGHKLLRGAVWPHPDQAPGGGVVALVSAQGQLMWWPSPQLAAADCYLQVLQRLAGMPPGRWHLYLHGPALAQVPAVARWLAQHPEVVWHPCPVPMPPRTPAQPLKAAPAEPPSPPAPAATSSRPSPPAPHLPATPPTTAFNPPLAQPHRESPMNLTHLQRLEAESIHIMREVVAEADKPVMLYSIGKDSAVMLHLARKAFYPAPPPFPLLHVDTTWKFRAMYEMRDRMAKELGMDLLVHHNPEAQEMGINPFTHGSQIHTDMWKTQGLKQALDKYGFDVAFGGARRDEEKSRAKERIFSFRSAQHRWDPKNQRPELWHLYNGRKQKGESIRCFPISNWTELDIWQYIHLEHIPIVPLYMAAERPVVDRDGTLIMVDDERFPLREGEVPMMKSVRFRTLGCYPLSGAVESTASNLKDIIQEMLLTKTSERQGRMIDHDAAASMEKKKQEGYF